MVREWYVSVLVTMSTYAIGLGLWISVLVQLLLFASPCTNFVFVQSHP